MLTKNDYIYINFIINLGTIGLIDRGTVVDILSLKYNDEQYDEALSNILSKTLSDEDEETDFYLGRG